MKFGKVRPPVAHSPFRSGRTGPAPMPVGRGATQLRALQMAADASAPAQLMQKHAYNSLRGKLATAGSVRAGKSHPVHGKGSVPDGYGTQLIAEARQDVADLRGKGDNATADAIQRVIDKSGID